MTTGGAAAGRAVRIIVLFNAICYAALCAGCGLNGSPSGDTGASTLLGDAERMAATACERAPDAAGAATTVVLDWTGGASRHARGGLTTAFTVDLLTIAGDEIPESLTDESFQQAVLARVRRILCDLDPMDVAVIISEAEYHPDSTILHISGAVPPGDGNQIGQSDYDPCNLYADDAGLVWGGALAGRIGEATVDQWVNAFANTIAHEIGHTLGFFHPAEVDLARALPIPAAEVMRKSTRISELLESQAFLYEQDTCPGGDGSYALLPATDSLNDGPAVNPIRPLSKAVFTSHDAKSHDHIVTCGLAE